MEVRIRLKEIRTAKGLTLKDLADITSMSYVYINDIENHKKNPSVESLYKIAQALNVNISELLGESNFTSTPLTKEQQDIINSTDNLTTEQLLLLKQIIEQFKKAN